jgi:DNA-binding transcriptional MerR regulator
MLSIGEFSTLSHMSVKTLRFYDVSGVFRPAYVDRNTHYRYYAPTQIADLAVIRRLRAYCIPLSEIRNLMRDRARANRLHDLLLRKRTELVRQVHEDEQRLVDLDEWMRQLAQPDTPAYAVRLKRIEARRVAVIRTSISCYGDAAGLFDELRHHVRRRGAQSGTRAAIWHTCGGSGGSIDCEAFLVAKQPVSSSPRIDVHEVPSSFVASVVHQGLIEMSHSPYDAARAWIASTGYRVTGPKQEIYWAGEVGEDNDSDVTEIQFPIARV